MGQGYLSRPDLTEAVVKEGWYCTGDVARIDGDGFITLTGRQSRFSKIGGEMVPHMLLEEKINQLAGCIDPQFVVTAVADEKRGERLLVFYVEPCDVDALYAKLKESNLPNLWIPARNDFYAIEALPLLGSGKLDLTRLRRMAIERLS